MIGAWILWAIITVCWSLTYDCCNNNMVINPWALTAMVVIGAVLWFA